MQFLRIIVGETDLRTPEKVLEKKLDETLI